MQSRLAPERLAQARPLLIMPSDAFHFLSDPDGFGPPAGPSLRAIGPQWSEADFLKFFRTGVDANGRAIDPDNMPWKDIGAAYTDDELRAMYVYLHGLT